MKTLLSIVFLLGGIFFMSCKNGALLNSKAKLLYSTKVPGKEYNINVLYLPSNATIQSAIQVRKKYKDKEDIIETYERYNYMDTCRLISDTTFMIVIRDTISVLGNKPDTIMLSIK